MNIYHWLHDGVLCIQSLDTVIRPYIPFTPIENVKVTSSYLYTEDEDGYTERAETNISTLDGFIGMTITAVERGFVESDWRGEQEYLEFTFSDGSITTMSHIQDCCESVTLEEVIGDFEDIIDSPIVVFSETTEQAVEWGSPRWTFYKIDTIKGGVTLRWYGDSEYYGVEVDIY